MMFRLNALALCLIASGVRGQSTTTGCLYTMEQLITEEEAVTDYSVTREYVFCEGRSFVIGTVDLNNEFVQATDTHRFFPVRPNMHVRCGDTGARENSCILLGGDVQVDATNYFGVGNNLDVTNVVFEGFTFVGASRYSVYGTKPGDITFIDCEWKDITEAYAPLFFDYFDPSALSTTLDVSFVGCKFQGNVYYGDGSYPALIAANGGQNHLTIDRCDFTSNDYIHNNTHFEKNSYLIEANGALSLTLNCFTNNSVGVSIAAAYGVPITSENNYGVTSSGAKCGFLSNFEDATQLEAFTPVCKDYEANATCLSDTTNMPSASPSSFPSTIPPSDSPTSPTMAPSGSVGPSAQPSSNPSGDSPTVPPSGLEIPTLSPTKNAKSKACSAFAAESLVCATLIAAALML